MSKGWEKFWFIMSLLTQGSSYLSPSAYGVMHRLHHAHADTEQDPHSPKYDDNLFKMMWKTKNIYNDILNGRMKVEDKFTKQLPTWKAFDVVGDNWYVRVLFMAAYTAFYVAFATHWWMFLLLPVHFLTGPFHGAVINWFAHKYGYVTFKMKDTSKNFLPLDFLMLGESYHNNHHKFGARANFGYKWFEIDPVWLFIWMFDKVGMIKLKIRPAKVTVDTQPFLVD
jgi:stearoyl-CoA desaturase (delta-9 desaturase)